MSDAVTAVLAHGMLSSLSVVRTTLEFLRSRKLDEAARLDLESLIDEQMALVIDSLTDLARGLPAEALALLHPARVPLVETTEISIP